jgi:hypothetical protein
MPDSIFLILSLSKDAQAALQRIAQLGEEES